MAKRVVRTAATHEHPYSAFGGHPLALHVAALKAAAVGAADGSGTKLADLGVTDAEQLVAMASIEEAHANLATTLGVSKQELDNLVKEAREALPDRVAAEMDLPTQATFALGAFEPTADMRPSEADAAAAAPPPAALAASVNLTANMSPIRQQGARGTCVAFALTAINEYYRRLHGASLDLSEQHLYNEAKLIDGSPALCGTWQRFASQVLNARGECREAVWGYNPNLPCNNNGVMPANARTDAANYKVTLVALSPTNVGAIKTALAGRRPVGLSFPVFNSWYQSAETTRSGRITMPLQNEQSVGGHAVCLAGYQDDGSSPGGGYFLVRNSWGTGWGYQSPYGQGYGVIPYQYAASYGWEAYTLAAAVGLEPSAPPAPAPESGRTITITVRGNVNLVIE